MPEPRIVDARKILGRFTYSLSSFLAIMDQLEAVLLSEKNIHVGTLSTDLENDKKA
jgi:hypothetical protein